MSNELTLSQKRAIAGSKGGRSTVKRHGREHMRQIGKRGAETTHERYHLAPININDFAMVCRKTGKIKAFMFGADKWQKPSWERNGLELEGS